MLKDKASWNLQAGETLAALGLVDPAATRYYYALYQAAVHALTRDGRRPGQFASGAVRWTHATVQNNVGVARGRRSDGRLFEEMRGMREQADYGDKEVEPGCLAARVAAVRAFVEEATR